MGYPLVRIDKLHPDGSPRGSVYGYRIAEIEGAVLVYAPPRTRRIHIGGAWTPEGAGMAAFHRDWRFVPHPYEERGTARMYIDIVRSVEITRDRIAFVDLYLDVMIKAGQVTEKDEELLVRLSAAEAAAVRATRDHVRRRIAAGDPVFDPDSAFWSVRDDVRSLRPKMRRRPRDWPGAAG